VLYGCILTASTTCGCVHCNAVVENDLQNVDSSHFIYSLADLDKSLFV